MALATSELVLKENYFYLFQFFNKEKKNVLV